MITQVKPINISTDSVKEKREYKKSSFSSKWKEFASNTTLHGLRYVFQNSRSIPRRATWLVFLSAAAGAYTYFSATSLGKFMSRPIKTVISQEMPSGGLKFPAVTICNLNKFMKTKIDVADEDKNFEKLGLNISGCSETLAVRGNLTCGQALLCAYHKHGYVLVDNCNKTTRQKIIDVLDRTSERLLNREIFLAKYGHDMPGMIFLFCLFSFKVPCDAKDFVPTLTRIGICYTFNSDPKDSSMRQTFGGPEFGLSILLNLQTNESTLSDFASGLQVIVHDQKTFVDRNSGFNIYPGSHASVAINLKKHIRLKAPFETNCSRVDQLPGISKYTKDACVFQCYTNLTMDVCGCREAGFPDVGVNQMPVCSFRDDECAKRIKYAINLTECPCNSACSELEYESRVSYSKFPDTSIIKLIQNVHKANVSASYMKENFVFLQVGFQHLTYEKRQEFPAYGPESLFGELGGNMGLFLGCSFLTICEFLDYLWEVVTSKIKKRSPVVNAETSSSYY